MWDWWYLQKKIPEKSLQNSSYGYWSIPSLLRLHETNKSNTRRKKAWMLWKTFGQCWAGCGIPLHLPILGAGKYAHRPVGPLCLPAQHNLPAYHTSTNWRQRWGLKWPLFMLPAFFLFLTLLSTSHLVSAHVSLAAAQSIWHHFYLAHYMCFPAPYLTIHTRRHTHASTHTDTHTHTSWACGFEAAMTQSRFS